MLFKWKSEYPQEIKISIKICRRRQTHGIEGNFYGRKPRVAFRESCARKICLQNSFASPKNLFPGKCFQSFWFLNSSIFFFFFVWFSPLVHRVGVIFNFVVSNIFGIKIAQKANSRTAYLFHLYAVAPYQMSLCFKTFSIIKSRKSLLIKCNLREITVKSNRKRSRKTDNRSRDDIRRKGMSSEGKIISN